MAYISSDKVKEIRQAIRKEFPSKNGWKFSVTCKNYSSVNVDILESKFDFMEEIDPNDEYANKYRTYPINEFYIKENFANRHEIARVLLRIIEIIEKDNANYSRNAGDPTADYADYNYFINLQVGQWNKPFIKVD